MVTQKKHNSKLFRRIRLHRRGLKRLPAYDIVITKPTARRDGRYLDRIGFKSPYSNPVIVHIDLEKYLYWLQSGAKVSLNVKKLILKSLCAKK